MQKVTKSYKSLILLMAQASEKMKEISNLWKIIFALSLFLFMSGLDFVGVLIFEELLGRFKENQEKG